MQCGVRPAAAGWERTASRAEHACHPSGRTVACENSSTLVVGSGLVRVRGTGASGRPDERAAAAELLRWPSNCARMERAAEGVRRGAHIVVEQRRMQSRLGMQSDGAVQAARGSQTGRSLSETVAAGDQIASVESGQCGVGAAGLQAGGCCGRATRTKMVVAGDARAGLRRCARAGGRHQAGGLACRRSMIVSGAHADTQSACIMIAAGAPRCCAKQQTAACTTRRVRCTLAGAEQTSRYHADKR